jgi:hypothetical protein
MWMYGGLVLGGGDGQFHATAVIASSEEHATPFCTAYARYRTSILCHQLPSIDQNSEIWDFLNPTALTRPVRSAFRKRN